MGIKTMFKKKEPTEAELVEDLNRLGVSTRSGKGGREEKFGAFRQYAQERQAQKPGFSPVNPYAGVNMDGGSNPYAENNQGDQNGNPYGAQGGDSGLSNTSSNTYANSGPSNPYSKQTGGQISPYGGQNSSQESPYNRQSSPYASQNGPYSRQNGPGNGPNGPHNQNSAGSGPQAPNSANPYANARQRPAQRPAPTQNLSLSSNPYSKTASRTTPRRDADEESVLDLNALPMDQQLMGPRRPRKPAYDAETLDLNDLPPDEDDLNVDIDDLPEEEELNSEDEEVEAIKQDIRFVKQESLALTRNTLRMAQEADASGTNTLGMLGSQSERLYNAESNLLLAETQTKIADEKVKELKRLNRSIFIPATSGNPFNKKSRLRQQEAKIKTEKAQEKYLRDSNRKEMYASEQRIRQGITQNATNNETSRKYQGQRDLAAAQRYQFENDSEDDEMEKELASNLDQISQYSKKLRSTAQTMGQEVDSQNSRLNQIEENADKLDINVHLNNTRLSNIR